MNRLPRRDVGSTRDHPSGMPSLNAWLDVQKKSQKRDVPPDPALENCPTVWAESHEREIKFVKDKMLAHCAEEVRAGRYDCLAGLSNEKLQTVTDIIARWKNNDKAYLKRATKRMRTQQLPSVPELHGQGGARGRSWPATCRSLGSVGSRQGICRSCGRGRFKPIVLVVLDFYLALRV